ncbi:argininosuccinate lyase [Thermoflexus sp.]|uniref:argininosuccinate lyase n=1 Tax=Thermoflexus sp. TaxID=1969742 RepID=UPI0025D34697|nr:argininosuccinate lyase [Thermoflexus sp.]MDW8181353.1 argininosuccinate lyase [Anaerolineae bacterium]MCS6962783.1 argininosuccinate lyase [Thermoflexus sp.]MCS7351894.1 argininosuccinate lyase [Thermoflexus sp.]MCX7690081.1 argininosuccinate lyase [Thermoflexus sp.]MDW8185216.1 argininosuccinate lyase [Anaerolineae bacterium]
MRLWGASASPSLDPAFERLNASLSFDRRLYPQDIRGSIAWARALARAGLLTPEECNAIVTGLEAVKAELEAGAFAFQPTDEDIHTAIERRLTERIGPVAGKLHTGRSRNDQVATDLRLFLMEAWPRLDQGLRELEEALVAQAEAHPDLLMPGYTHLQRAQPIRYAHWCLAHAWAFERDRARWRDAYPRLATLPLGSGALSGTPFPIDREALARELGFLSVSPNSLDAVSDRDFVAEFLFIAAMIGVHLSRLAEDLILFTSAEFGFVALDPAYTTGSSLMPQKRNPDALELARAKAGRLVGHLTGFLTVLKGLPSGYNKDLQEDKEPVFDALDTLEALFAVLPGLVRTMRPRPERMQGALEEAMLATELADYLVRKGVPFREAHRAISGLVEESLREGRSLSALSLEAMRRHHPAFDSDVYEALNLEAAVERRSIPGGTGRAAIDAQIQALRASLDRSL